MKGKKIWVGVLAAIMLTAAMPVISGQANKASNMNEILMNGEKEDFTYKIFGSSIATANAGPVLLSTSSPEDDYLPAITVDGSGNIVAVWTHEISAVDGDIGLAYSTDNGATWNSGVVQIDGFHMPILATCMEAVMKDRSGMVYGSILLIQQEMQVLP